MRRTAIGLTAALVLGTSAAAVAQEPRRPVDEAGRIVSQPARDVGAAKIEVPAVLAAARKDPYGLPRGATCKRLVTEMKALNAVLGPDFAATPEAKENRAGRLAEAGGKTIVNALIPFRGLVREVSGAAPAQRRLNIAIDAGYARRGFLRGLHQARGCGTAR